MSADCSLLSKSSPLPPSPPTYAGALRTLARFLPSNNSPLQQPLEYALAAYSEAVNPGSIWTAVSALSWLNLSTSFPTSTLRSAAPSPGIDAAAPPVIRQLWFHPDDIHIVSTVDADFNAAANVSFELTLHTLFPDG